MLLSILQGFGVLFTCHTLFLLQCMGTSNLKYVNSFILRGHALHICFSVPQGAVNVH